MSSTMLGDTTSLQDREFRLDVETKDLAKLTQLDMIWRTGSKGEEDAEAREALRLSFNWNWVRRASICLCSLACCPASSMLPASIVSGWRSREAALATTPVKRESSCRRAGWREERAAEPRKIRETVSSWPVRN